MTTLLLLHLTGAAVYFDLREQRIPNGLILTGLLLGMVDQFQRSLWKGLVTYGAGIFVPVLMLGALYYFRMIGAGDIKLLSVIGGFLGPYNGFLCVIYTFLIGSVIATVLLIKRQNLISRFIYFKTYVFQYLQTKEWRPYIQKEDRDSQFYFSIPVLLSLLCYIGGVY